jgi:hypothetical protein
MLTSALDHLRDVDVIVSYLPRDPKAYADDVVEIALGEASARFAVERRQRAPFQNEIPGLERARRNLEKLGHPLIVATYIPEALGRALVEAGWSWADDQGNYDVRGAGLRLRQRRTFAAPRQPRRHMPTGSGSLAVIRTLIMLQEDSEDGHSPTEWAKLSLVSRPRVQQVLAGLGALELVQRTSRGRWRPDRSALLDQFLTEYQGPGGTERLLYSLDEPTTVTTKLARLAPPHSFVTSADVASDLVAPWRRPTTVIFYIASEIPINRLGFVEAHGRADANVIIREPRDRSIFPAVDLVAGTGDVEIPLADPSQIIWDLQDLGGDDRLEAAGRMRTWLLERR